MSRDYKNKDKYKGKRNNTKKGSNCDNKSRDSYAVEGVDSQGKDNDPTDYVTDPEIAKQASNLSFQSVLGSSPVANDVTLPTIMVARCNPSMGSTLFVEDYGTNEITASEMVQLNQHIDAVNMMGAKLYTLLSSFSGRTTTYGPCDVIMMIGAIASIAEYSEHLRRAFGVMFTYNPRNRALPKALVEAMGFDFDDMSANLADYRMKFNMQMTRINQIPLLDNIGFIRKCRRIYQKVYADAPTSMYQMYVMIPNSVWKFDEDSYSTGSALKTFKLSSLTDKKMGTHIQLLADMINRVVLSSTLQIVYSDILNLATKIHIPMWKFDYLSELYSVKPEYNRNFLLQIHNSTALCEPNTIQTDEFYDTHGYAVWHYTDTSGNTVTFNATSENDVVSYPGSNPDETDPRVMSILYNPTFTHRDVLPEVVIDFDTDLPTPGDIIDALRYTAMPSSSYVGNDAMGADFMVDVSPVLNDHYITEYEIFKPGSSLKFNESQWARGIGSNAPTKFAIMAQKFYMSPYFMMTAAGGAPMYTGDFNFFTSVNFKYLMRISQLFFTGLWEFVVKGNTGKDA